MDKLLRANNLYYQNWRFAIKNEPEDVNAYATAANLIVLHSSLYDSLYNDEEALAFALAHELSHLILGHAQVKLDLYKNRMELEEQLKHVVQLAEKQDYTARVNAAYNNSYASSINSLASSYNTYCAVRIKNDIDRTYTKERELELEADSEALVLYTRAGFDTKKAKHTLEFLSQLPEIETSKGSHPTSAKRLENIDSDILTLDLEELKKEGRCNICASKVIKTKKSTDGKTIILPRPSDKVPPKYIPETKEQKLLKKAYRCYLNNDLDSSEKYFKEAFETNESNYVPALYLSYIFEQKFIANNEKNTLKQAAKWAKIAYKINENDKNIIEQRNDIINTFKTLKKSKNIQKKNQVTQ